MTDKIVELTAQQFRAKLQEMVRREFAKRLLESEEGEGEFETSGAPPGEEHKESSVDQAKREILDRLKKSVVYIDRTNRAKRDETEEFLKFVREFAKAHSKESYMAVSSLEDLAGRIAVNYSTSQDWAKAKKEADDLTTKFIVSKGSSAAAARKEKETVANSEFKGKEEEILQLINTKLTPVRGSKIPKATLISQFAEWLKKTYPNVVSKNDDSITAFTKYAEYFSQPVIPADKSPRNDLATFLASKRPTLDTGVVATQDADADEEEALAAASKAAAMGSYMSVAGTEGEGVEELAAKLGISAPTVGNILKAIPPGKVKAIYDTLVALVKSGNTLEARRNMEAYAKLTDRAIVSAQKEFLLLIDDAIDESTTDELTLANLIAVVEDAKLREDMTPSEENAEDMFFNKIVEIVNDPEYADNDEWKSIVAEMLKGDLESSITVKDPQGKKVRTTNISKSFQALVSQAVGLLDPGSRKLGAGSKSVGAQRAQQIQNQEFPDDYRIGLIGKTKRAPAKAKAPKATEPAV